LRGEFVPDKARRIFFLNRLARSPPFVLVMLSKPIGDLTVRKSNAGYLLDNVKAMVGIMHNKPAVIKLPKG